MTALGPGDKVKVVATDRQLDDIYISHPDARRQLLEAEYVVVASVGDGITVYAPGEGNTGTWWLKNDYVTPYVEFKIGDRVRINLPADSAFHLKTGVIGSVEDGDLWTFGVRFDDDSGVAWFTREELLLEGRAAVKEDNSTTPELESFKKKVLAVAKKYAAGNDGWCSTINDALKELGFPEDVDVCKPQTVRVVLEVSIDPDDLDNRQDGINNDNIAFRLSHETSDEFYKWIKSFEIIEE